MLLHNFHIQTFPPFVTFVLRRIDLRVIVKKSSSKNLSADCRSTVGRQITDSLPTANQQRNLRNLQHTRQSKNRIGR